MMELQNQMDHVRQELGYQPEYTTREIAIPGIENLHERSAKEIGLVLANVLRTEPNIVKLEWEIGKPIRLTTRPDHLRV